MDPIFPGSYKYDAKHWANVHHHINQMEKVDRLTFFEVGTIMKTSSEIQPPLTTCTIPNNGTIG